MSLEKLTYLTTKQLAAEYPAFPVGTLKKMAADHPAVIRVKTEKNNKRSKVVWIREFFELSLRGGSPELKQAIDRERGLIETFLAELTKKPVGRPRKHNQANVIQMTGGGRG